MKITEELWNDAACKFNNFKTDAWTLDHCNRDRSLFYTKALLRYITKKEVFVIFPDIFSNLKVSKTETSQKNSELFIEKIYNFFSDPEFLKRHSLVPAFKCIVPVTSGSIEGKLETNDDVEEEDLPTNIDGTSIIDETSTPSPDLDYVSNNSSNGSKLKLSVRRYVTKPVYLFGDELVILLGHTELGFVPTVILFTSDSAEEVTNIYNECNQILSWYSNTLIKEDGYFINIGNISYSRLNFTPCKIHLRNPIIPEETYNEDLPEERIAQFIKEDISGISIFYGIPGCGKSTYIKYLATKFPKNTFNIISQDILFHHMSEFRNHLLTTDKGRGTSLFIIEDCEKLLVSRESSENISTSILAELLNMSDGIIGDYLNIKFILTFNTQIPKIDKAVLRKGRLKLKYEFKPLQGERLKALAEKRGITLTSENIKEGMSLADIFNYNKTVDFSEKTHEKKIGF